MPIHDWTRVDAGVFHHFHNAWIQEICATLNDQVLPSDYYAVSEQDAGDIVPDIVTLKMREPQSPESLSNLATVTRTPPQVQVAAELQTPLYPALQKRIAVRSSHDHERVALVELLSLGNRSSQAAFDDLLSKLAAALRLGLHLLLIDLHRPTRRDPQGLHAALWEYLGDEHYQPPEHKPLTLVSYNAGVPLRAFVEPCAVGDSLASMPIFLDREHYANVPLENTYDAAFQRVPRALREPLETP